MLRSSLLSLVACYALFPAVVRADDPIAQRATHLEMLGVQDWHQQQWRGRGVRVAILDSGFRQYRDYLGTALPARVMTRSFREDQNLEAKDSQHGILCAEIVHAIAPEAELLFANWEPDNPDSFLRAVGWAKEQGAKVLTCSVIMPGWSDGRGGGPVHERLVRIVGDGTRPTDMLCCASAGNLAQRHWSGAFLDTGDRWHGWLGNRRDNRITPWDRGSISVELTSTPGSRYDVWIIDERTGMRVGERHDLPGGGHAYRFHPADGTLYAVRVQHVGGNAGPIRLVVLGASLEHSTTAGSISFPADGQAMLAVGAVSQDGKRSGYSSCGPCGAAPKPDFVAPVPFPSRWRSQPFSGTSAAAPQVAGMVTLWRQAYPNWSPQQVSLAMRHNARDLATPGHDRETGFGMIALPTRRSVLQTMQ